MYYYGISVTITEYTYRKHITFVIYKKVYYKISSCMPCVPQSISLCISKGFHFVRYNISHIFGMSNLNNICPVIWWWCFYKRTRWKNYNVFQCKHLASLILYHEWTLNINRWYFIFNFYLILITWICINIIHI